MPKTSGHSPALFSYTGLEAKKLGGQMSINDIKRLNDKTLLTPISTAPTPFPALCYRVWRLRRRGQAQGKGSLLPWTSTLASSNVAWSLLLPLLFLLFIPLFHSHPKV